MIELTDEILARVISVRRSESHKGDYGRLLVVGGSAQYGGAAILAASSAVYSGTGLVTVATDSVNHTALHARLPEAMVLDWSQAFDLSGYDVIVIGCGLGLEPAALGLLQRVLAEQGREQWLVVDGSAITLFAREALQLAFPARVVFTPHQMELERLSGLAITEGQSDQAVQSFTADQLGAYVVAKSHRTRVFSPNQYESPYLLTIGSPAQATGGMGDTLAGMIGGFLGQFGGSQPRDTIAAATYLHSKIAMELAQTSYVVLPSRLISEIPRLMKQYCGQ